MVLPLPKRLGYEGVLRTVESEPDALSEHNSHQVSQPNGSRENRVAELSDDDLVGRLDQ